MARTPRAYRVVDMPPTRRGTANYLDLYWWRHSVYALLEVDVTVPRRLIRQLEQRTGEALSFTGYLIHCVARAVAEDPSVQAYRKGSRQLAVFDDVDVFVPVECEVEGSLVAVPHIVEAADRKSLWEIHCEIRQFQDNPPAGGSGMPAWFQTLMRAPAPLPRLFVKLMRAAGRRDPGRIAAAAGTVGVTAVGMAGRGGGWGLAPGGQSLLLIVGGIAAKPAVVNDHVEPRELLDLTLVFNHDVVDGAPAARFAQRLVELIEDGSSLRELAVGVPAEEGELR